MCIDYIYIYIYILLLSLRKPPWLFYIDETMVLTENRARLGNSSTPQESCSTTTAAQVARPTYAPTSTPPWCPIQPNIYSIIEITPNTLTSYISKHSRQLNSTLFTRYFLLWRLSGIVCILWIPRLFIG